MAVENKNVSFFSFEPFDSKKTAWSRWVKRFETALTLYECDNTKHQRLLLHFIGSDTYNILCDKLTPQFPEDKTYREIVTLLQNHFDPKPNEILENFRFNMRRQKDGEKASDFLVALRQLSANCNFGTHLDKALRNQFVFGLLDNKLQSRLLEKKNLTLDDAITMATACELAEKGGNELKGNGKETVSVHKMAEKNKRANANTKKCFRCGDPRHTADKCKFKEATCHFCKKKGHLRKVCFKEKKQLHHIEGNSENNTASSTVEEILQINDPQNVLSIREKIMYKLEVNNKSINFEVDTGAPVSIINLKDAKEYFPKLEVKFPDMELVSYCGTPLKCVGYVWVNIKNEIDTNVKLYIVRSDRKPLMGREWLFKIKLNWNEVLNKDGNNWVNTIQIKESSQQIQMLLQKYPSVFSKSIGKISELQARLYLKPNVTPKFVKARRVPFPLMEAVEKQLQEHVDEGLLVKVERSEWATPVVVVPKKNGAVRICGDYKITLNPALVVDEYPLPTVEELFSKMAGGVKFSKIDLTKAYLQLEIHPEDRHLLTLNTHKGLYRPTRMMYGIASAPAKWQRLMEQVLGDIPGVSVFLDDIKITAPNDETHFQRIEEVLKRLEKFNMRINVEKSEFMRDSIEYCGYLINKDGIQRIKAKVEAIQNMKQPQNKDEVRAFLGLINYYGRFIKNLSDILFPLNRLLQNDVKFEFNAKCEKAFLEIKKQMQSDTVLTHYDPKLPLLLAVDASPTGVGAVLSHMYGDGSEKPIQFASQTLSKVQQRYSQIDREAYAIIYGVRKFYNYLYGKKFCLITDNRAVSQIFSPSKGLPVHSATRMQHYALFLEQFEYEMKCKKSKENANADAMSRLPNTDTYNFIEEVYVIEEEMMDNLPVTLEDLKKQTQMDNEVKNLIKCLEYGRESESKDRFGVAQTEFSLHNGCILRGIRVYIPKPLRKKILNELHSAHFGISRMKSLARAYVWWNQMDKDIEMLVSKCALCQSTRPDPKRVTPVHCWTKPNKPFERVHADYAGPFMGKYLFILVDAFSKWPEVYIVPNMTAETTIQKCREIFSQFGIPNIFVSDHGTQFNSGEFQNFLKINGIVHKQGAPYHPATNGQAERYVQTIKYKLLASKCTPNTMGTELSKILLAYRRAIHPTTGKSPSMLMLGRQIQSRLDLILPDNDVNHKLSLITKKKFLKGDRVSVRDYLSKNKWQFGVVEESIGELHYNIVLDDGRRWKRHVDQMRKVNVESNTPFNQPDPDPTPNIEQPNEAVNHGVPQSILRQQPEVQTSETHIPEMGVEPDVNTQSNPSQRPIEVETELRRSQRQRKMPQRFLE